MADQQQKRVWLPTPGFATKGVYVSLDEKRMDMPSYFCPSNCKDSKGRKLLYQVSNYLYKTNALSGAVEFKDHPYKCTSKKISYTGTVRMYGCHLAKATQCEDYSLATFFCDTCTRVYPYEKAFKKHFFNHAHGENDDEDSKAHTAEAVESEEWEEDDEEEEEACAIRMLKGLKNLPSSHPVPSPPSVPSPKLEASPPRSYKLEASPPHSYPSISSMPSVSVTQKPASAKPISNNDNFRSTKIEVVMTDRNGNHGEKKKRQAKLRKDKSLGNVYKKMEEKGPLLLNELRASKAAKEMEEDNDRREEEEEVYKSHHMPSVDPAMDRRQPPSWPVPPSMLNNFFVYRGPPHGNYGSSLPPYAPPSEPYYASQKPPPPYSAPYYHPPPPPQYPPYSRNYDYPYPPAFSRPPYPSYNYILPRPASDLPHD